MLAGRPYVTPLIAGNVQPSVCAQAPRSPRGQGGLTPRQREVLQLVAEGYAAKEIATILDVSVKTVEFHKARIVEQLNLRTTAELTRYAVAHGLVGLELRGGGAPRPTGPGRPPEVPRSKVLDRLFRFGFGRRRLGGAGGSNPGHALFEAAHRGFGGDGPCRFALESRAPRGHVFDAQDQPSQRDVEREQDDRQDQQQLVQRLRGVCFRHRDAKDLADVGDHRAAARPRHGAEAVEVGAELAVLG